MKILNKERLEKLLLANWADLLDIRELIVFVNQQIMSIDIEPIDNLTLTRFEPQNDCFLVWIECVSKKSSTKVYVTVEALLKLSGELKLVQLDY